MKVLSVNGDGKIGLSIKRATQSATQREGRRKPLPEKFPRETHVFGRGRMSFEDKLAKFLKDSDEGSRI